MEEGLRLSVQPVLRRDALQCRGLGPLIKKAVILLQSPFKDYLQPPFFIRPWSGFPVSQSPVWELRFLYDLGMPGPRASGKWLCFFGLWPPHV